VNAVNAVNAVDERSIVIKRTFHAPRAKVFAMWSDPRYVARWWGTAGSTSTVIAWNFQTGGAWQIEMRTKSGATFTNRGVFGTLTQNESITYTDIVDPALCWSDGRPAPQGAYTITFVDSGQTTEVTIHARFANAEDAQRVRGSGMIEGIGEGLTRLERLLEEQT
jgi:uncharacterized protein YndB with AHSA1/START domain